MLFIHGAGGFDEDRRIADELAGSLGVSVRMPEFSDDDMSYDAWAEPILGHLDSLSPNEIAVGHSFGASILLQVLADHPELTPAQVVLLAMPDWSRDGWDVADYAFRGPQPQVPITLHHCRDDEVVDFSHLTLNSAALPSARVVEHDSGGHQFDGVVDAVAAGIRS